MRSWGGPETRVPQTSRSLSGWCRRRGRGSGRRCWHLQGREGEAGDGGGGSPGGSRLLRNGKQEKRVVLAGEHGENHGVGRPRGERGPVRLSWGLGGKFRQKPRQALAPRLATPRERRPSPARVCNPWWMRDTVTVETLFRGVAVQCHGMSTREGAGGLGSGSSSVPAGLCGRRRPASLRLSFPPLCHGMQQDLALTVFVKVY